MFGILIPLEAQSCEAVLLSITPQSKALCPPSPALLLSMSTGTIHRETLSQGGPERGMEDLAGFTSRSVCVTRLGLSKQLSAVLGTARRDTSDLIGQEEPFLGLLLAFLGKSPFSTGIPGCWQSL